MSAGGRWPAVVVTAVIVALAACGESSGPGGEPGDDSIRVGVDVDQPGLAVKDGESYRGFDVEVARYVAHELGFSRDQIMFVAAPADQREGMVQGDQVKMVVASYPIPAKAPPSVTFAGPYFVAGQDLLVRADDPSITGPGSLNGKRLCSVKGSGSALLVREYSSAVRLQPHDSYGACVEALSSGSVDAVSTDNLLLAGYAAEPRFQGKLKVFGRPFSTVAYGIALKKGDLATCAKVSTALDKMAQDGSWQRELDRAVGSSGFRPDSKTNPPKPAPCA